MWRLAKSILRLGGLGCLFIWHSAVAEIVDMGPLTGSVEGHVWSKVINEAGQVQSRDEVWQVQMAAPALVEVSMRCPDPYPLEVLVQWLGDEGPADYALERVSGGFSKRFSWPWNPVTMRNLRVLVRSRHPGTDQQYQLSLSFGDGAAGNASPAQSDAAAPPTDLTAFLGNWLRMEDGAVAEYMELAQSGDALEIIFRAADGQTITSRLPASLRDGAVVATSAGRRVRIVASAGRLEYVSSNLDGSGPWQSWFTRD